MKWVNYVAVNFVFLL